MNRHKLVRGGVQVALMLLLALLIVSSLVACGNLKSKESKVELVPHDAETLFVESYDYVSMFEATVDGKPFEITAENIDASAVKLNEEGTYDVKCEIEVDGKKYSATAKLTVNAPKGPSVVIVPHDSETFFADDFDYVSMFDATVDGNPFEIEEENIDSSAVKLNEEGTYDVKCEIEVEGKKYSATAKLTVNEPRNFSVVAKSSDLKVVFIGDQLDVTTLFSATVANQPYTLTAQDIDTDLDLTKEGLYEVTASLTIDGATKSASRKIYVIPAANYDISGAMKYNYNNYSAKITVEEDDNGYKATDSIIVKEAEGKYYFERLPLSDDEETHDIYEFQVDAETGYPSKIYHYNETEKQWEKKADMDLYAYVNHVEADEEFAQYFSFGEDGMFVADADEQTLYEMAWSLLCYNTSLIGDVTSLKVRVENNKIVKIVVESKYESGEDYVDTYLITVELDDFGAVDFELPYFEPSVEITPVNAEVYVGATEYDFLSMFTIKVDGHNYTLGEGDEYKIEQSVDFNVAADYDVTLKLTVKEGREEHTATAKLTVKEKPVVENDFRTAMEAMIANCTMTKYTKISASVKESAQGTFLVDGNATYKQSSNTLYDTSKTEGNKTQQYIVQDGVVGAASMVNGSFLRLCDLTPIIDEFEKGEDGKTYTYTGTDDQLKTLIVNAGVMATTNTQAVNIEVVFENGAIQTIKLNYKSNKTSKDILYHRYVISAIGTTELPVQLPKA